VEWKGYTAEYNLTQYIAGTNSFLLRFWHRSGSKAIVYAIDNWGIKGKIVPLGEGVANP